MDKFHEVLEKVDLGNKTRISNKVSDIILKYVKENNLKPGSKLPSESQLTNTLGVSTRSIREALKILEARGFIEILQGKGAFLIDKVYANYLETLTTSLQFTLDSDTLILNLVEVREIIETAMIETVALNRTPEDLIKLEEIIKKMDMAAEMGNLEMFNTYDAAFHKAIIDCGKNNILISFYDVLLELIFESFKKTGYKVFLNEDTRKETKSSHQNMLAAIKDKNPASAREILSAHLNETKTTLLELNKE